MSQFIEFKNVTKEYKTGETILKAADNLNFSIDEGEFVVILGPSGSGKSTLLNLLGGLDTVTNGTITVNSKEISKLNDNQLTKYRAEEIGFIFQFYNLIPNLNTLENIELINDISNKKIDGMGYLKEVDLLNHAENFPSELSGGEQQRVSIARALAKEPSMLLCDEPTGALNRSSSDEVMNELLSLNCDGTTIMCVTHDPKVAAKCSRILYIVDGGIMGECEPGRYVSGDKQRHEKVRKFLEGMGW